MRLIRRQDRERLGISFRNIESPFFAKANVEFALHLPHTPLNLFHDLKSALGISSRSLVHRWTLAGGTDQIPGYATHIDSVSKASKYLKLGGWIGTGIGGGASYMKVQDVCSAGNTEACKRVKFTEAGSFAGGIGGGALAGALLTAPTVAGICLAIGVPTVGVGTVVCSVVVVGAGSYVGGEVFGSIGEKAGEVIYEAIK